MEISLSTYRKLLRDTNRVVRHQKELAKLKGEGFNVFSILNMENSENKTHSAFLGELLNPKGSHNFGNVFLKKFLKQIGIKEHIDLATAQVKLEYYLGKRNDKDAVGGRVDIYIIDGRGHTFCLENKLYAGDQKAQIARYCNYNSDKNKVFYLNLDGGMPDKQSIQNKKKDKDFTIISYEYDIVTWLDKCIKEAVNAPILRETIKQYSILIKKLTNQLTDQDMKKEVEEIILENYKAAHVIKSNIGKLELKYAKLFIDEIAEGVRKKLGERWQVVVDPDLNKTWTGIKIRHHNWPKDIRVKLEGASKIPWNRSIYGFHVHKSKYDRAKLKLALSEISFLQSGFGETEHWPYHAKILSFGSSEERSKLFKEEKRALLVKETVDKLTNICLLTEKPLCNIS